MQGCCLVYIATQCLKQGVVFIITVFVETHDCLSTKKTFNVQKKRRKCLKRDYCVSERKVALSPKSGNANGGSSTTLMCQQKNSWKSHLRTYVHYARKRYWRKQNQVHCLVSHSVISEIRSFFGKKLPFCRQSFSKKTFVDKVLDQYCEKILEGVVSVPIAMNVNLWHFFQKWYRHFFLSYFFYSERGLPCTKTYQLVDYTRV